ncbi:GNAT family N-acetyltransferase [Pseudoroseicyclus aestuarii]|uniref:N-acetyltransferase domain-containing protein n=1 Tax=Pseudoroseicyclus aestuarii TaxID=1795041 RepID=A0A318SXC3_9RHOB|nr:GNAT family N-acetyltransferase [Pseudoroseicyclus aestuarii]PYE84989.1 hypothetical protein DFP88_102794 [Pseudoroseicyclus aestuarii]
MDDAVKDLPVRRSEDASAGRYIIDLPGGAKAELTWTARDTSQGSLRIATHTGVPEAFGGRGIAGRLVSALVEDARAQGFRIVPACSYVALWARRHPETQELFAG